jgi:WD40 repeat protein
VVSESSTQRKQVLDLLALRARAFHLRRTLFPVTNSLAFAVGAKRMPRMSFFRRRRAMKPMSGWICLVIVTFSVALSPDEIAGQTKDRLAVRISEMQTYEGFRTSVALLKFSPDGKSVLAAARDGTLSTLDAATGKETRRLAGPSTEITSVAFSNDGKRISAGAKDGGLWLWEGDGTQPKFRLEGPRDAVLAVGFAAEGRRLLSGSGGVDHSMRIWDVDKGKEMTKPGFNKKGIVYALAFSPDGRFALTGHASEVKLWEVATGKEIAVFKGHNGRVTSVAFSKDGRLAVSGSKDKTVHVWELAQKRGRALEGHKDTVNAVSFTPDGKRILSGSADKSLRLWDVATGKTLHVAEGHKDEVVSLAVAPDGTRLVSGGADKTVRLWLLEK